MATLTEAEISYIRAKSGDVACEGADPVVSDVLMQVYYDTAEGDLPTVIVSVLEDMWAEAEAAVEILATGETRISSANVRAIKDRLDYWRGRAGIFEPSASIAVGTLNLGIDTPCDTEW